MEPLQPDDPAQIGEYRLAARLGAGGMGRVYLGHSAAGRPVVVKVVHEHFAQDKGFRSRFGRDVAAARAVIGAFTAPVIDADPDAPTPWLVTAFRPGLSLQEAVAEHGPFEDSAVYALGTGLAEGLDSIHKAGLMHGDLKPSNVLLSQDGPHIIDLDIARAAEGNAGTQAGGGVGAPGYMSPEQADGRKVGPAADVFSLGAVLTYAATGEGPFGEGSAQIMIYRVVHADPRLEAVSDRYLRAVIAACLSKDPELRPSPAQVLDRLAPQGMDPRGTGWLPAPIASDIADRTALPPPAVTTAAPSGGDGLTRRRLLIIGGAGGVALTVGGVAAAIAAARWPSGAPSAGNSTSGPASAVPGRPGTPAQVRSAGQVAWRYHATDDVEYGPYLGSGMVFLLEGKSPSTVVALDAATGRRRWRSAALRGVTNSRPELTFPLVVADGLVYVARRGVIYAINADSGTVRWSYETGARGPQTEPAVVGGTLYCLVRGRRPEAAYRGGLQLVALDAPTGSFKWSRTAPAVRDIPGDDPNHDPDGASVDLAAAGALISVIDGDLFTFDVAAKRFRSHHLLTGTAAATVTGGVVFAADAGGLRAVRAGKVRWAFKQGDRAGRFAPVVRGGMVYAGAGSALYAVDAATGRERWRFSPGDGTSTDGVAAAGDQVYLARYKSLYAVDAATGRPRWQYRSDDIVGPNVAAVKDAVYVRSGRRDVYALRAPGRPGAATD
jgi:outer membrane protein assembly factor BamB